MDETHTDDLYKTTGQKLKSQFWFRRENLLQSDAVTWLVPVNSKVSESLQDFQENVILT